MGKDDEFKPGTKSTIPWRGVRSRKEVEALNEASVRKAQEERERQRRLAEEKCLKEVSLDVVAAEMFFALKDDPRCTKAAIVRMQDRFKKEAYDFQGFAAGSADDWKEDPVFYLVLADQRLRQIDTIADEILGSIVAIVSPEENGDEQFQGQEIGVFKSLVKTLRLYNLNRSLHTASDIQKIAMGYKEMRRPSAEIIPLFR